MQHVSSWSVVFVSACLAAVTAGCSGDSADGDGDGSGDRVATIAGLTGNTANGNSVYSANCAACHGADGKSGTENRNIAAYSADSKNDAIGQIISGGGNMPAYGSQLDDQEIADVVAYAASLK